MRLALVSAAASGAAVLAFLWLLRPGALPDGPEPVAWSRDTCAYCRMLVGDPDFAAQLQTRAGDVLHFDDPGCLLRYRAEADPDVHAVYFHHSSDDVWIPDARVAFVPAAQPTPMGYGLAAVFAGTAAGEISPADALERAHARDAERREEPDPAGHAGHEGGG